MRILSAVSGVILVLCLVQSVSLWPIATAAQAPGGTTIITGVVTDPQGNPSRNRPIRLWQIYDDGSGIGVMREPTAVTDAAGRYALTGVPRGTYLVESLGFEVPQFPRTVAPLPHSVFHPGTAVANEARRLVVAGEQRIDGIDIVRRERRLARIWGRAFEANGGPLRARVAGDNPLSAQVALISTRDGVGIPFSQLTVDPASDGSFAFAHVQPGAYILRATLTARPAVPRPESVVRVNREVVVEQITVGEADLENVQLRLRPTRNMSGRIVIDAKAPPAPPMRFSLTAEQRDPALDPAALIPLAPVVSIFEDRTLVLEGLIAPARVFFSNPPRGGWYLAAIRSATGEAIDGLLEPGIAEPIEFVMKDDGVTVSGTLNGFDAAASLQLSVALFPVDARRRWGWPAIRTTRVQADFPHYYFESVPPGEHFVVAYATNPAATRPVTLSPMLAALEPLARRITITPRQHLSVDLPTVSPRW